jgi:hypothetical protein
MYHYYCYFLIFQPLQNRANAAPTAPHSTSGVQPGVPLQVRASAARAITTRLLKGAFSCPRPRITFAPTLAELTAWLELTRSISTVVAAEARIEPALRGPSSAVSFTPRLTGHTVRG